MSPTCQTRTENNRFTNCHLTQYSNSKIYWECERGSRGNISGQWPQTEAPNGEHWDPEVLKVGESPSGVGFGDRVPLPSWLGIWGASYEFCQRGPGWTSNGKTFWSHRTLLFAPICRCFVCVPVDTNTSRRYLPQQHMETCWCLGLERWPMDHEVLLFLVLLSGILCHRHYVYRPLHLDSFRVN